MSMVTVPSVLPDSILAADFIQRKFQGANRPNVYVGERSGRYNYGLAGGGGMGHAITRRNIIERRSRFGYGLAGMGQICDGSGNCYDDSGNFIGTQDPSGTQPFVPVTGYDGPLPVLVGDYGTPGAATGTPSGPIGPQPVAGPSNIPPGSTVQLSNGQTVQTPAAGASAAAQIAFWTNLVNQGFSLAKLTVVQPGTAQSGGNIIRQNPQFPVSPIATSTGVGVNANVSTGAGLALGSTALIGIGIVALLLMSQGNKRGGR